MRLKKTKTTQIDEQTHPFIFTDMLTDYSLYL